MTGASRLQRFAGKPPSTMSARHLSRTAAVVLFVIICCVGLGADQFTKWLTFGNESTKLFTAVHHEPDRWVVIGSDERRIVAIPKLLHFHATVNEGAVFGLG